MIPALAENTYVYVFNYVGDDNDFDADKAAYNTELEKHFNAATALGFIEKGLGVTGADLLVENLPVGDRKISLASAKDSGSEINHPLVIYKGVAVPYSDFGVGGFNQTGSVIQLKGSSGTPYPSLVGTDWLVFYSDHLLGTLVALDAGDISLPLETNAFNAVGHADPVIRTTKRTNPESNGSITVMNSLSSFLFDTETTPNNFPGEDLLRRVYGSDWTLQGGYDVRNKLKVPTNSFGICVVQLSGKALAGDAAGNVWASLMFVYNARVTTVGAPTGIANDSTDPIQQTVEFDTRYPDDVEQTVILTGA